MIVNQNSDNQNPSQFRRIGTEVARKAAYGTMTGGVGRGVRMGAEQAYRSGLNSAAERTANRYRARKDGQEKGEGGTEGQGKPKKKLTGPAFWFIMFLAVVKDLSDIVGDLTMILSFLTILTGAAISFILFFYLYYEGVSVDTRKVVTWIISATIAFIPFVNMLPETAICLLMTRIFENSSKLKALASNKMTGSISKVV